MVLAQEATSAKVTAVPPLYHDIDCPRCKHKGRHVVGRQTDTIYCVPCGGPCREL